MTIAPSIWKWTLTKDLDTLVERLVTASSAEFEAIADAAFEEAPEVFDMDEIRQSMQQSLRNIEALDLPDGIKATLLGQIRGEIDAMDNDDWDEEEDEFDEDEGQEADIHARQEVPLVVSHMLFNAPYSGLDPADIMTQVENRLADFRDTISAVLKAPAVRFLDHMGIVPGTDQADAFYTACEDFGIEGIEWVWPGKTATHYLMRAQEGADQPIELLLGHAAPGLFDEIKATSH